MACDTKMGEHSIPLSFINLLQTCQDKNECIKLFNRVVLYDCNSHNMLFYVNTDLFSIEDYKEICEASIKLNVMSIQFVKRDILSLEDYKELCWVGIRKNIECYFYLDHNYILSVEFKKMSLEVISQKEDYFKYVLHVYPNLNFNDYAEICKYAIFRYNNVLMYVNVSNLKQKDYLDLCINSVEQYPSSISDVILSAISNDDYKIICLIGIKYNCDVGKIKGEYLKRIDYFGICCMAVNRRPSAFHEVQMNLLSFNQRRRLFFRFIQSFIKN